MVAVYSGMVWWGETVSHLNWNMSAHEVGRPSRWPLLLALLKSKSTSLLIKRSPLCMCVLYTGAKTLFTVANANAWQKWFLLLYWFANQLRTYHHRLSWTVYCICKCVCARCETVWKHPQWLYLTKTMQYICVILFHFVPVEPFEMLHLGPSNRASSASSGYVYCQQLKLFENMKTIQFA